ncbi:TetR/AcrR family transcriptional regulator [Cytobacillus sp. Sa5YUA1]|uniref:TetR/AcrR family transcriptional regulator n=1 Tax=Cytobacillus stercorigallinarum TaxID=2762240 RepID=A0ABR8QPP7_9BACI|nr:TetR/AcrR family transcriptional regulator [Cytobacillus stercorigallinarum]MBD7937517.1 TetR/AcrR family transcriptional regulator [Cytobacillus stercorigallinarum]
MARPVGQTSTRKDIITVAQDLFAKKGYTATSMDDIRTKMNVSKGTLYYHFKKKEDLFLECVKVASEDWFLEWAEQSKQVKTATDKLYLLGKIYAMDTKNSLSSTIPEFLGAEHFELSAIKKELLDLIKPEYTAFEQVIQEGIENKEFNEGMNKENLVFILYTTLTGLSVAHSVYIEDDNSKVENMFREAIAYFINGIK